MTFSFCHLQRKNCTTPLSSVCFERDLNSVKKCFHEKITAISRKLFFLCVIRPRDLVSSSKEMVIRIAQMYTPCLASLSKQTTTHLHKNTLKYPRFYCRKKNIMFEKKEQILTFFNPLLLKDKSKCRWMIDAHRCSQMIRMYKSSLATNS